MPDLPTITINDQALLDRIIAAFGDVATYKAWLRIAVRDYVIKHEVDQLKEAAQAEQIARRDEIARGINLYP